MRIVVTQRSGDFHACIEGHPEYWAAGKTGEAAVGDLIRSNRDIFGIQIVFPHEVEFLSEPERPLLKGNGAKVFGEISIDPESHGLHMRLFLSAEKGSKNESSDLLQMENLVAKLRIIVKTLNQYMNIRTWSRTTPHGDRVDQVDVGIYVI